jgi:RNA polymerase sigma-70 factor (ECF subfamily)
MDNHYIQRVLAGDQQAFRYLVEKHQGRALATAFNMVKTKETAEDIVQESFVKAYKNLNTFRGEAKFSTWFLRIVVNESIRYLERRKLENSYAKELAEVDEHSVNSSLKQMQTDEQKRYINIAMQQMPAREALVLQLYYLDDMNLKEMEEITSINPDHLKVLLHRARKQFFGIIQKELKHEVSSII